MRRLIGFVLAVATMAIAAACGGNASSDPYELLRLSGTSTQNLVQVDVGASVKSSGTTVTLDPGTVRLVLDKTAGKGTFHLSLPASALGIPAAQLAQLGVTGATIDLDALWDGQDVYAKSPILGALLTAFAGQSGITLPSGDLSGWLKVLTKADLDTLASGAGVTATPGPTPADAAALKSALEEIGIALTLGATEQKNGVNANRITGAVDMAKVLASPAFDSLSRTQLSQFQSSLEDATVSFDMWLDASSHQMVELDVHIVGKDTGTTGSIDVTVAFSTPSSPDFSAPAGAIEIPTIQLIGQLIQLFGASLGG